MINLDDRILDHITASELQLVCFIARRMKSNRMTAWPSVQTLANEMNCDPRKIRATIGTLVAKGFVGVLYRSGKPNLYTFRKTGISIFSPIDDRELEEHDPSQKMSEVPMTENVPPTFFDPSQKMSDEVINKNTTTNARECQTLDQSVKSALQWVHANFATWKNWHELRKVNLADAKSGMEVEEITFFFSHYREKYDSADAHMVFTNPLRFFTNRYPNWITMTSRLKKSDHDNNKPRTNIRKKNNIKLGDIDYTKL